MKKIEYKIYNFFITTNQMEYSLISKQLTSTISKTDKQKNGIYFTPPACVIHNIDLLKNYMTDVVSVLEPSCGSCEYITALHSLYPHLNITGIEYNKTIYDSILQLQNDNVHIYNEDYLTKVNPSLPEEKGKPAKLII